MSKIQYRGVIKRFKQRNAMIYRGSLGSLTCIMRPSSDTRDSIGYPFYVYLVLYRSLDFVIEALVI
jgi:hypothetical protein